MCPICWLYRLSRRIADRIVDWAYVAELVEPRVVVAAVVGRR